MKAVIVCSSVSHGNTKKVADVLGRVLEADVVDPAGIDAATLVGYDLVGFGSGIYMGEFRSELREFIESLAPEPRGKAFVFATSGFADAGFQRFSRPLVELLERKGFDVVDTFSCRGHDTFLPFKPVGGIRKGRPNADDLAAARVFAEKLQVAGPAVS